MAWQDDEMSKPRGSRSLTGCLRMTPWSAFLTAALFVAGLALFIGGAVKVEEYTMQIADAIGVSSSLSGQLKSGLLTAVLAVSITGVAIIALVVMLALWRVAYKSMLWGDCCCTCDKPEPWLFTAYRTAGGLLNVLVWLLLLAVVGALMFMLLWLGGAVAVNAAITRGTNAADTLLGPLGLSLAQASDASAAAMAFLSPLAASPAAAAQLLGTAGSAGSYVFQPLCPPVCLNLGSFAMFMQSSSCICGSDKLNSIRQAAQEGTKVAIISLSGAFAMYVASTLLLMILTAHYVEARFDRSTARQMKRQQEEEYENGYMADPNDCVVVPAGPHQLYSAPATPPMPAGPAVRAAAPSPTAGPPGGLVPSPMGGGFGMKYQPQGRQAAAIL